MSLNKHLFCNAFNVHVIYSAVSGQYSYTIDRPNYECNVKFYEYKF